MHLRIAVCLLLLTMTGPKQSFASEQDSLNKKSTYLPSLAHLQFAGFMGVFSAGFGYHYMQEKMSTSLFYGYVPKAYSTRPIQTLALKHTVSIYDGSRLFKHSMPVFPVLYGGFTFNCEISKHSFITLPDYYPTGYYSTQALHFTFFTGLRVHIPVSKTKNNAIEPYAEVGTLDTYLWYYISDRINDTDDIFRLALGLNYFFR
jgi:hypothetical protein